MIFVKIYFFVISLLFFCLNNVSAANLVEQWGDTLSIALPVIAYGSTLYLDDTEGQQQFYLSFLTTTIVSHGLKNIVAKKRPNGGSHSFPSAHTSSAFQGAAFIHRRYGIKYGIPSYLAASFVAFSRVENEFHFNDDVIFGAAIGLFANLEFTTTRRKYTISPLLTQSRIVFQITTIL